MEIFEELDHVVTRHLPYSSETTCEMSYSVQKVFGVEHELSNPPSLFIDLGRDPAIDLDAFFGEQGQLSLRLPLDAFWYPAVEGSTEVVFGIIPNVVPEFRWNPRHP